MHFHFLSLETHKPSLKILSSVSWNSNFACLVFIFDQTFICMANTLNNASQTWKLFAFNHKCNKIFCSVCSHIRMGRFKFVHIFPDNACAIQTCMPMHAQFHSKNGTCACAENCWHSFHCVHQFCISILQVKNLHVHAKKTKLKNHAFVLHTVGKVAWKIDDTGRHCCSRHECAILNLPNGLDAEAGIHC